MFPLQKFKQREICERSVHRETFLHSLDRIAHAPLIMKIAYNEEIPPLSCYQYEVISPLYFVLEGLCMCR